MLNICLGKRQHRRSPKAEAIPEPEPVAEALPVETVIVYVTVDQFGNRIGEPRTVAPEHTPAPAPTPDPSPVTATPESTQKASPDLDTSYGTSKGVASVSGKAIVYSPYRADRNCKSESEVAADIAQIQDFSLIRLYGIDCNQVQYVRASIKKPSTKLFIGIYDIERYEEQVQTLISIMGGDWSDVHTVAIGNEVVNSGRMSAGAVVERVNKARTILRGAGYNGPVVTVDTWVAIMANPSLCEASDYIAANCHPYFDGNVPASGAGDFLVVQGNNVKKTCPGKDLLITGKFILDNPVCEAITNYI